MLAELAAHHCNPNMLFIISKLNSMSETTIVACVSSVCSEKLETQRISKILHTCTARAGPIQCLRERQFIKSFQTCCLFAFEALHHGAHETMVKACQLVITVISQMHHRSQTDPMLAEMTVHHIIANTLFVAFKAQRTGEPMIMVCRSPTTVFGHEVPELPRLLGLPHKCTNGV